MNKAENFRKEQNDKFLAVTHILKALCEDLEFNECLSAGNCPGYSMKQAVQTVCNSKKADTEDAEE